MQQVQPCVQQCEGMRDQAPRLQYAACLLLIMSYEWAMAALPGRVLICKSYGDGYYDKQGIYGPQMPRGTEVNMLHAHLACLALMEQVGNNWLFQKCCISFHFSQKACLLGSCNFSLHQFTSF